MDLPLSDRQRQLKRLVPTYSLVEMNDEAPISGVTMGDVAQRAGVHSSTVSRALKNDPRISEDVKKRVRKIAEDLGYRPNPMITALTTLRSQHKRIALPLCLAYIQREVEKPAPHFFGAETIANRNGYKLEVFTINQKLSARRLNQILMIRNIRGLILAPLPEAHGSYSLDWDQYATVAIEYTFTHPRFDRIVPDSYSSVIRIMEQCVQLGYERIGMALTPKVDECNEGLLTAAYIRFLRHQQKLPELAPLITSSTDSSDTLKRWLLKERPQVVISSNMLLPKIEDCIGSLNLNVPENIGLANLNIFPGGKKYSGTSLDARMMGAQAATHLINKLNHNEFGVPAAQMTTQMGIKWIEGQTLIPTAKMVTPGIFKRESARS